MSKCDRSQKVLETLEEIGRGIESLKGLVREGPGEEESIQSRARQVAASMYLSPDGHDNYCKRANKIEALVREEVETCLEAARTWKHTGVGSQIACKIEKRLSR